MLVITRKKDQVFIIRDEDTAEELCRVTVGRVTSGKVRLQCAAPERIGIYRLELLEEIAETSTQDGSTVRQ